MKLGLPLALMVCLIATTALSGCNVFDPFDSPTSDAQLLSAANACLDQGDFQCASDDYSKIASDIGDQQAGLAYTATNEAGATMGAFMEAFGTGGNNLGPGLTTLANTVATGTPGEATRMAIYTALYNAVFSPSTLISQTDTKNFVAFITGTALAAEILAEASTGGVVHKTDIASDGTACNDTSCLAAGCTATTKLANGSSIDYSQNQQPNSAVPTIQQLTEAIKVASDGLNALTSSGSSGGFGAIGNTLNDIASKSGACARASLLDAGVGQ